MGEHTINILIFGMDTTRFGVCRLPGDLHTAGFRVALLSPRGDLLGQTCFVEHHYLLHDTRALPKILKNIEESIRAWTPELIIPADERAVACLHALAMGNLAISPGLAQLLTNSLGKGQQFAATLHKHSTHHFCEEVGIATPPSCWTDNFTEAIAAAEAFTYPTIIKKSFSWNGMGVQFCNNSQELTESWDNFKSERSSAFKLQLRRWLGRDWYPSNLPIGIQRQISGPLTIYCLVAYAGEVLAGFAASSKTEGKTTAPSSVVRLFDHPELATICARFVEATGYTGFAGFDFIMDAAGVFYLLECNPRPIPQAHLGGLLGRSLSQALYCRLSNQVQPLPSTGTEITVALFPQEWLRDPMSPYLRSAYHDVPWHDPQLLQALIGYWPQ